MSNLQKQKKFFLTIKHRMITMQNHRGDMTV